jgi:hypothetical protein
MSESLPFHHKLAPFCLLLKSMEIDLNQMWIVVIRKLFLIISNKFKIFLFLNKFLKINFENCFYLIYFLYLKDTKPIYYSTILRLFFRLRNIFSFFSSFDFNLTWIETFADTVEITTLSPGQIHACHDSWPHRDRTESMSFQTYMNCIWLNIFKNK